MTDRERAAKTLMNYYKNDKNIGPNIPYAITPEEVVDLMIAFRDEGLREELIKFTRIFCDGGYKHHLQTNISMKDAIAGMVDEYLKTK